MLVALLSRCLKSTVFHAVPSAVGRTHASIVMPVVRSSELESGTWTRSLTPSKLSAWPNLPAVQVGPLTVPLFAFPLMSETAVPVPSSNEYAATRPGGGGGAVFETVTFTAAEVSTFPDASRARALSAYGPLETVKVFQEIE